MYLYYSLPRNISAASLLPSDFIPGHSTMHKLFFYISNFMHKLIEICNTIMMVFKHFDNNQPVKCSLGFGLLDEYWI